METKSKMVTKNGKISKFSKKKTKKDSLRYFKVDAEPATILPTSVPSSKNRKFTKKKHLGSSYTDDIEQRERNLTDVLFGGGTGQLQNEISSHFLGSNYEELLSVGSDAVESYEEPTDDIGEPPAKRKPVWVDDEDSFIRVKDVSVSDSVAKTKSRGQALREKFSLVTGGDSEWAQLDRKILDEEDEEEEEDDMKRKTTTFLTPEYRSRKLPNDLISIKKVGNLNQDGSSEGNTIKVIDFKSDISIALVSGVRSDKHGAVSLFQFDGKKNHKLKSIFFPNFPIKCVRFLRKKQQFVAASNKYGRFFAYDIQEGKKISVMWPSNSDRNSMKTFEVSPDGNHLAFVRPGGEINFYNAETLTMFETVKIPSEVADIAFNPETTIMYSFGENGFVYMFDLASWQCTHCFYDDGCISGTTIATSPNGRLLACGSSSGIVNVYDTSLLTSSGNPKPLKSFGSLVTSITSLAFHPTSEILAIVSQHKHNALKLIHTGSLTVFPNFPGGYPLGKVFSLAFTPDGKYISAGNNEKKALLFRLLHY